MPDRCAVAVRLVIDDPKIVVCVRVFEIGFDCPLRAFLGFLVALRHQLANSDFIEQGSVAGFALERGLVVSTASRKFFSKRSSSPRLSSSSAEAPGEGGSTRCSGGGPTSTCSLF